MTQDKELLLKDICSRLPYGVKVLVDNKHWRDFDGHTPSKITFDNSYRLVFLGTEIGYVKPYLFPHSSMTEEERIAIGNEFAYGQPHKAMDLLHKRHIDYRGLIERGLAIDATGLNIY